MLQGNRPYLPDQDLLLSPSLREWLAEDQLAYFVSDVVDQLDLSAMDAVYGEERRGQRGHFLQQWLEGLLQLPGERLRLLHSHLIGIARW